MENNIYKNLEIKKLLSELNYPLGLVTFVENKDVAIRNLKRLKALPAEHITCLKEMVKRAGNSFYSIRNYPDQIFMFLTNETYVDFLCLMAKKNILKDNTFFWENIRRCLQLDIFSNGFNSTAMLEAYEMWKNIDHIATPYCLSILYVLLISDKEKLARVVAKHMSLFTDCYVYKEKDDSYSIIYDRNDANHFSFTSLELFYEINHFGFFAHNSEGIAKIAKHVHNQEQYAIVDMISTVYHQYREIYSSLTLANNRNDMMTAISNLPENCSFLLECLKQIHSHLSQIFINDEDFCSSFFEIVSRCSEISYDTNMVRNFTNSLLKTTDLEVIQVMQSETGFMNACTGNRYFSLMKKLHESMIETNGRTFFRYAVLNKKKAFLKLADENFSFIENLPDTSILYMRNFTKICNINSLNVKNLQTLNKQNSSGNFLYTYNECELQEFAATGREFTFNEIIKVCAQPSALRNIYIHLNIDNIDRRLLTISQLLHTGFNFNSLSCEECIHIANSLSKKLFIDWEIQLNGYFLQSTDSKSNYSNDIFLSLTEYLKLIGLMNTPLSSEITNCTTVLEAKTIIYNSENPLLKELGIKEFINRFLENDNDSVWLIKEAGITKTELAEYNSSILNFCISGYASMVKTFYERTFDAQKENILLIAKAAMFDLLDKLRYTDFNEELQYNISADIVNNWKQNTFNSSDRFFAFESSDFFHSFSIGVLTGHTCLSYIDGVYRDCLLSNFDGNKKILYIKKGERYAARAILRLTKFTSLSKREQDKLSFIDVSENEEKERDTSKEKLILFLETMYHHELNHEEVEKSEKLFIALAREKAKTMGVNLVIANTYSIHEDYGPVEHISGYIYISKSKNGKQYLDSFGGKSEQGGSYKSGNYVFLQ